MGETLRFEVNGHAVTYDCIGRFGSQMRDKAVVAVVVVLALVALAMAFPSLAFADVISDFINNGIVDVVLAPIANSGFDELKRWVDKMNDGSAGDLLTAPFDKLLSITGGSGVSQNIYDSIKAVKVSTINPIAASLLSLVILMQLVKISQRMDSNAQMPALKEVFQLFVFCAVWMWVLRHNTDLLKDVYDVFRGMMDSAWASPGNTLPDQVIPIPNADNLKLDVGQALMVVVNVGISLIMSMFVNVFVIFMALARGVQVYLYLLFAPIGFCFLGFDETKQWGLGFIKGFVAVCLSGTIMLIALWLYPGLIASYVGSDFGLDQMAYLLAANLLIMMVCANSGKYARDILGG